MKKTVLLPFLAMALLANEASAQIKAYVNQIGFGANAEKIAVYDGAPSGTITIRSVDGGSVNQTITPKSAKTWAEAGAGSSYRILDFTSLTTAGKYAVYENNTKISPDFEIGASYTKLTREALRYYYLHRAVTPITAPYGEGFERGEGHNRQARIYNANGAATNPAQYIQSFRGWYDAGDHGRYVVNCGISTYTLLALYERYANKIPDFNIPPDPDYPTLPQLLAEIKWNLDWMLTMQDESDGGVYHKMTTINHAAMVLPENDNAQLVVTAKTTSATLNFAGVMAVASRVYRPFNETYANKMLAAAKSAWTWAKANPSVCRRNTWGSGNCTTNIIDPTYTGEYGDNNVADEFFFAAGALAAVTSGTEQAEFLTYINSNKGSSYFATQWTGWQEVGPLGAYEIALNGVTGHAEAAKTAIINAANSFVETYETHAFALPFSDVFWWGSNATAGNKGIKLLVAYEFTKEEKYKNAAQSVLDYLLGRNPINQSYVTGFGVNPPNNTHDRISYAMKRNTQTPVGTIPGMLVGGPANGCKGNDSTSTKVPLTTPKAKSWEDHEDCYAYTEVTINWNAPLAYLAVALNEDPNTTPIRLPQTAKSNNSVVAIHNGLSLTATTGTTVRIYDSQGRMQYARAFAPGVYNVSLSHLPKGVYIASIDGSTLRIVVR